MTLCKVVNFSVSKRFFGYRQCIEVIVRRMENDRNPQRIWKTVSLLRQQRLSIQESAIINELYGTFYSIEAARLGCLPIPPGDYYMTFYALPPGVEPPRPTPQFREKPPFS